MDEITATDREYVEVSATSIQKKWKRYMSVNRAAKIKVASILGSRWRRKKRIKLREMRLCSALDTASSKESQCGLNATAGVHADQESTQLREVHQNA